MVLGLVVVNFVNRDGGVDDRWLDSLLLDDWLNGLDFLRQQGLHRMALIELDLTS